MGLLRECSCPYQGPYTTMSETLWYYKATLTNREIQGDSGTLYYLFQRLIDRNKWPSWVRGCSSVTNLEQSRHELELTVTEAGKEALALIPQFQLIGQVLPNESLPAPLQVDTDVDRVKVARSYLTKLSPAELRQLFSEFQDKIYVQKGS